MILMGRIQILMDQLVSCVEKGWGKGVQILEMGHIMEESQKSAEPVAAKCGGGTENIRITDPLHSLGLGHVTKNQNKDVMGQGELILSPNGYIGPSISNVERSMHDKGLESKEKRALSKRSPKKIMGASKKRSRGKLEYRLESTLPIKRARRNSGPNVASIGTKGRKLNTAASKNSSGMVEAVVL